MPTMSSMNNSVAANAVSSNLLSGKNYEFTPYDALVEVYATCSATGLNITLVAGQDIAINDESIPHISSTAEASTNAHFVDSFEVSEGTQLRATLRNTTGGALTGNLLIKVTPL